MDQEVEQVWKCIKKSYLYFDKQINFPCFGESFREKKKKKGPDRKKEKKKKSDANVNRKIWHHEVETKTGKMKGSKCFVMRVG